MPHTVPSFLTDTQKYFFSMGGFGMVSMNVFGCGEPCCMSRKRKKTFDFRRTVYLLNEKIPTPPTPCALSMVCWRESSAHPVLNDPLDGCLVLICRSGVGTPVYEELEPRTAHVRASNEDGRSVRIFRHRPTSRRRSDGIHLRP